ncbi:MAG TPA: YtxH domain-containing protein [Geobacteraceae bacterium]|nr:YtxH domain-containing protein [Geobacteraceae bacterium]
MKSKGTESTALLAFLAGAVVAAGLTLLLTPKAGREVREKLGDVSEGAVQKFRACAREAKFRVAPKTKEDAFYYEGGDCWI